MDVIEKLNQMRLERNLTVYRLSELSGLSQSTLANTFSRRTVPSVKNLALMCEAMGVTLSQFFAENEEQEYISAEEAELLKKYRNLPQEIRQSLNEFLSTVSSHSEL